MDLVGKVVLIDGIKARPMLNGQPAIVNSFDEGSGRCQLRLLSVEVSCKQRISLKPERLLAWADRPIAAIGDKEGSSEEEEAAPAPGVTPDDIMNANPAKLLGHFRDERLILCDDDDVLMACIQRNLDLPILTTGEELVNGGIIEMLVQAIDAQMNNRGILFLLLSGIGMTLTAGQTYVEGKRFNLNHKMRDRAIDAGAIDRIQRCLAQHTTGDIQCAALALVHGLAAGGPFKETLERKRACSILLPQIVRTMDAAPPHETSVQHFGMWALAYILEGGNDAISAEWADGVIALGGHKSVLEAMRRHGHVLGENGRCSHKIKTADGWSNATLTADGSILLAGCQALACLVVASDEVGKEARIKALNEENALSIIASAIRSNPTAYSDTDGLNQDLLNESDLFGSSLVPRLLFTLCGDRPLKDSIPDEEDRLLLVGEFGRGGDQGLNSAMDKNPSAILEGDHASLLRLCYMHSMLSGGTPVDREQ